MLCLIDTNFLKIKDFGERLTDDNSLGFQSYITIFNLGFWKKLVYILEKKLSLQLCMKFSDFKNFQLLMKAFMTQEEKIKNKQLLDLWTSKAQIKGFLLEKQRIMTQQVKRNQVNELYDEFKKSSKDIISSVQLNQKQMQAMLGIQESISEFIAIFFKKLTREEHQ